LNTLSLKERFRLSRFFSGEKAVVEPIKLTHRRIFILPTYRGLNFAILTALLLLMAFVYKNNLVYLLTFLLASIFFITILHSYQALAGLVLQKGHSKAVFAGEAAGFTIYINNPVDVERFNLQIKLEQAESFSIKPQSKVCITLYSLTQKRGWHTAGTVTLSSAYPFGLFRAWSPIRFDLKVLVYPKLSLQERPFPEMPSITVQKGFSQKGADDFYGLKSYQPGDSIKQIHWKAFAKGQGLFSKQYSSDSSEEIWLDYDNTPGHNIEERLSRLCRWVIDAERAGIPYGFSLPGLKLSPDNSTIHTRKCLEALALF
jgi:uncharacterized protein (DUF58 family)